MWMVGVAWGYVVVMMTIAEATSDTGTVLGALVTFVLYGVLPLSIVLYLLGTPGRRRRRDAELQQTTFQDPSMPAAIATSASSDTVVVSSDRGGAALDPDRRGHSPGDPVAPERIEP